MSDLPTDAWFYSKDGERIGPVDLAELRVLATTGNLNPRLDLCWTHGMADWVPAGEINELFPKADHADLDEDPPNLSAGSSYRSTRDLSKLSEAELELELLKAKWPGASRRVYLFATLIFPVLASILLSVLAKVLLKPDDESYSMILESATQVLGLVIILLYIMVSLMRLKNLSMSRWWFLANLVPGLNLWIGYRIICCPAGYGFHRKMDGIGIVLAVIYWLLIVAMLVAIVFVTLAFFDIISDFGLFEAILENLPDT